MRLLQVSLSALAAVALSGGLAASITNGNYRSAAERWSGGSLQFLFDTPTDEMQGEAPAFPPSITVAGRGHGNVGPAVVTPGGKRIPANAAAPVSPGEQFAALVDPDEDVLLDGSAAEVASADRNNQHGIWRAGGLQRAAEVRGPSANARQNRPGREGTLRLPHSQGIGQGLFLENLAGDLDLGDQPLSNVPPLIDIVEVSPSTGTEALETLPTTPHAIPLPAAGLLLLGGLGALGGLSAYRRRRG
jgi:hypothetical protein